MPSLVPPAIDGPNRANDPIAPRRQLDTWPWSAKTVEMKTNDALSPSLIVGLPLGIPRSALFAVGRSPADTSQRRVVPIAPYRGAKLIQTGPALGQHHALAWQAVIHWAKEAGIEDDRPFTVAADDLLRVLGGRGQDSAQRCRMGRWLAELAATHIDYRTDMHKFEGPLLGQARADSRGRPLLRLPVGWQALVRVEISRNNLGRKCGLGLHSLGLWLHDYIATHQRPPPVTVDTLRHWSGSAQDLPHFRHDLRAALRRLAPKVPSTALDAPEPCKPAPNALVLDWQIDRRDRLHIEKSPTSVHLSETGGKAAAIAKTSTRQELEVQRARMQRAKVAL